MDPRPVVFLQPPADFANSRPCLDDKQYGLGILALMAWMERHGFSVVGLHLPLAFHSGVDWTQIEERLAGIRPLVFALGLNWVHFSAGALQLAERLKKRFPEVPVVVGGQHATLFADEVLREGSGSVDAVIVGEGERPLLGLCRALRDGNGIPEELPGLARPAAPAAAPDVEPQVDTLPPYSYRSVWPEAQDTSAGALSTARGACPYRCAWCIEAVIGKLQGRRKLIFHSPARIADQVEKLLAEGVTRFTVQDNFFVGGDRLISAVAEELAQRNLRPAHLNVFAHPESYSEEGFAALAAVAERASVDFGVETGCPEVAGRNHREMDPAQVVAAVETAMRCGVEPYTWWMVGLPGESEVSLRRTEELIRSTMGAGGIPRWVSPLILFPGTAIFRNPEAYGVALRFTGFHDFMRFSTTTLAEALLFQDLSTHSLRGVPESWTGDASLHLRRFIHSRFDLLEARYPPTERLRPDLDAARRTIAQSFL